MKFLDVCLDRRKYEMEKQTTYLALKIKFQQLMCSLQSEMTTQ